ncbi:TraB/GumN family protein [Wenzhouxiangella limi]|uniref:TraB/GumN family protein n=1 Tax=Wenzhouxiangella limi TaxID=2707351 RepID=A0A845UXY1_9GAMM|nr:TraB/GumN family protein [Wenzhouxiangella limi]NDY95364.1 TraB/GumN family protein [Wenzhouxiangella limi]
MRFLSRLWVSALLVWMFAGAAQAQVLWSVKGPEGQQNWLLGTVHSEDPRLLEFPEAVLEALADSDRLALELVPDASLLEILNQAMHYPEPRLDQVLAAGPYEKLVEILGDSYGMGEPVVRRLRPWAAAMTLSVPPPQTGLFMDLALSIRAGGLSLEVVSLERIEEQLAFLADMPESMQLNLLEQAIEDFARQDEMFETLVRSYLAGDLARLEAVAREQMAGLDPALRAHFEQVGMIERNHTMVKRALPWLEAGGLMIAVGALHLPGEEGLIELLRARGMTVEPALGPYEDPS